MECVYWYDEENDMSVTDCGADYDGEVTFEHCPTCSYPIVWTKNTPFNLKEE